MNNLRLEMPCILKFNFGNPMNMLSCIKKKVKTKPKKFYFTAVQLLYRTPLLS